LNCVIIGAIVVVNDENKNNDTYNIDDINCIENSNKNTNNYTGTNTDTDTDIENMYEEMVKIISKYNAHYENFKQTSKNDNKPSRIYTNENISINTSYNYLASSPIPIPCKKIC
jgi:hypothetical protein